MGKLGTGVEVRDSSIRLQFNVEGRFVRERLTSDGQAVLPTPANIKYAHRVMADIRRAIANGTFVFEQFFPDSPNAQGGNRGTFGDLADAWLTTQGRLAPATLDQYGTAARFWKKLLGEATTLRSIDHRLLARKIGGHPWPSAKTHNNYMIALRGILALEYRGPKAAANPAIGIENMAVVKRLPDPLTLAERDAILGDMTQRYDPRVVAYFIFAFYTGMRPEEMIALRWSDVDFTSGTARVQRVRTFKGSERDGSKTHTERDVDLVPQALAAIQAMKPYTFMKRGAGEDQSADVFENPLTDKPWHDERSQRDTFWRPSLKRLGVRWRRAYNTRHTFATAALMAGVPPAYIAAQLGHSVQMLLTKYTRWIAADGGNARALLAAAMGQTTQDGPQNGDSAGRRDWTRTNVGAKRA